MKKSSKTNRTKAVIIVGVSFLALLFATTSPAPVVPHIGGVLVYPTSQQITIIGTNLDSFGQNPRVKLANVPLTVNSVASTSIVATYPNSFAPGSYVLLVTFGNNGPTLIFDGVTIPAAPAGGGGGMQEFTTSGTLVVPPGVTKLIVEVWGAGGGGGSGHNGFDDQGNLICQGIGGYGAAGAYSRAVMNVAVGETVTVTVGQGGIAGGGAGGFSSVAATSSTITSGGGGGGENVTVCDVTGANGSPGIPDPTAPIGRSSAAVSGGSFTNPEPGSIQPIGCRGGIWGFYDPGFVPPTAGGDGYAFIQW